MLSTSTLGHLFQVDLNTGNLTEIADLSEYELLNNPDGGDYISNPFGFVIEGDTAYIADGGANVIFTAKLDGSSLTATPLPTQTIEDPVFPPVQPGSEPGSSVPPLEQLPEQVEIQSVPTGIDIGPRWCCIRWRIHGCSFSRR